jgi:hypothetical protein
VYDDSLRPPTEGDSPGSIDGEIEVEGFRRKLMFGFDDVIDAAGDVGGGMVGRRSVGEWIGPAEAGSSGWMKEAS